MDAAAIVIAIAAAASAVSWVLSLVTGDSSWVDRMWSLLPIAYVWIFALAAGLQDPRLDIMAVLVTLWGARLTVSFGRKGGYRGVEDYRWPVLRERLSRRQWFVLNLVFVSLAQNALLVLIALPAWTALQHAGTSFGAVDAALTLLFLVCLLGETTADQQQWDFQEAKRLAREEGRPAGAGFVQSGLWRYSRHPNYFFELGQWWVFFLLGASAAGSPWQWTALGAGLLTVLLAASSRFTESISASRYPQYAEYRRRTSAIVPLPPRRARVTSP